MNNSPDSSQVLSTTHTKLYSASHAPQILKSSSYHSQLLSGSRHALSLQSSGSIVSLENSSIKSDNPAWGDSSALAESLSQKKKEADIIRRKCIAIETKLENEKQKIKFLEEEISEISKKRNEKISGKRENDPRISEINKEREKKDKEIGKLKELIERIEQEEGKVKGEIQKLQGEWNYYKVKSGEENKKYQSEIYEIDQILGKKKFFDEKEIENNHRVKEVKDEMEKLTKEVYEIKEKLEKKDEEEKELLKSIAEMKMNNENLINRLREKEIEQKNKEKETLDEKTLQSNGENSTNQEFDINEKSNNGLIPEEIISFHIEEKQAHSEILEEPNSWQIDFEPPMEINIEIPVQNIEAKEEVHIEILNTTAHEAISKQIIDIESHKQSEIVPKTNGIQKENIPETIPTFNENIELVLDENVWGIDEDFQAVVEISKKSEILSPIQGNLEEKIETKQDFVELSPIINSFESKDIEKVETHQKLFSEIIEINSQKSAEMKIEEPIKVEKSNEPEKSVQEISFPKENIEIYTEKVAESEIKATETSKEENKSEHEIPNLQKSIEEVHSKPKEIIETDTEKTTESEMKAIETTKDGKKSEIKIPSSQKSIEEVKVETLNHEPNSLPKPKPLFNKPKFAAPARKTLTQKKIADVNFDPDEFFQEMSKKPQK
ncbi:unnamed protein product [Blepharisma stoltei]|uniref:Uncharacterized protein n=1 Tax=Blepharisma stoltei TaxID=1481888 RepID=A0AAU9IVF2_9CILI|nr:unnamed protein product [Blepharisma stoltei]